MTGLELRQVCVSTSHCWECKCSPECDEFFESHGFKVPEEFSEEELKDDLEDYVWLY